MKATINAICIRQVPVEKIKKYLSDKDFNYKSEAPLTDGVIDRIWLWLSEHFFAPVFNTAVTSWSFLSYTLLALVAVLLIYFLRSGEVNRLFYKAEDVSKPFNGFVEEDIHGLDFDALIAAALANGQYRLIVRYLYLQILRALSEKNLISWQQNKTNFDYLNELKNPDFNQLFRETTHLFNCVWYGDFTLTEKKFVAIKDAFDRFKNQIKTGSEKPQ